MSPTGRSLCSAGRLNTWNDVASVGMPIATSNNAVLSPVLACSRESRVDGASADHPLPAAELELSHKQACAGVTS